MNYYDRIYNLLEDKGLFPEKLGVSTQIMFVNLGDAEAKYCLGLVAELRANGISCELYPDSAKMKKQMKYADGKNVELVAIVGETEMGHINRMVKVKNMTTGDQVTQTFKKLISDLKQ